MAGRAHLGVMDEEKAKLIQMRDEMERQRLQASAWLAEEQKRHVFVKEDEPIDFSSIEAQRGKMLGFVKFGDMLKRLPGGHNLVFKDHETRPFRGVYWLRSTGHLQRISIYGRVKLYEFSVLLLKPKIVPDGFNTRHISHLDMPSMEFKGLDIGFVPKDPDALRPGWKKVYEMQGEDAEDPQSRGWRKVLMDGVVQGFWSPVDVERIFGRSDRASWVDAMGHQKLNLRY